MTPRLIPLLAISLAIAPELTRAEQGGPIRPLAQDFVVVGQSPDPQTTPLYTPSILRLPGGRLVACYEQGKAGREGGKPYLYILTSDDGGKTWTPRAENFIGYGRLFTAGRSIYIIGQQTDLSIIRSDDNGETWSNPSKLTEGQSWHQSACNVWHTRSNVYLVMEHRVIREGKGWPVGQLAPVLMRAKETDDLTKRESWTFASELPFCDIIPGYKENAPQIDYFGVPFFKQAYPNRAIVHPDSKRTNSPMGWLESNVVQILDPNHYWFDPSGHTFHIFLRAHTGTTGYAALAKVVENDDGTMTTSLVQVPSGKTMLLLPLPGGQMRFHVLYDEKTKLYWLLSSQATDSMTRVEKLPPERYDLPNNERHRMVLHFSKNMVDWCFAGIVAMTDSPRQARHYAAMDIDGDDLVVLSRSGDENAKSAHEGNIITFHRVKNFRDLAY